jgi:hypothetical protein
MQPAIVRAQMRTGAARRLCCRYGLVDSRAKSGEACNGGTSRGDDAEQETDGLRDAVAGEVTQRGISHSSVSPQPVQRRLGLRGSITVGRDRNRMPGKSARKVSSRHSGIGLQQVSVGLHCMTVPPSTAIV